MSKSDEIENNNSTKLGFVSIAKGLLKHFFDLPKTVLFNFRVLSFKEALKLPIFVSRNVRIIEAHRGNIIIPKNCKRFSIEIGLGGTEAITYKRKSELLLMKDSKIIFNGPASLSKGIIIRNANGTITFGANFYSNRNLSILCSRSISFGDDVLIGWDCCVRDCDGHKVYVKNKCTNGSKPVFIDNHVWIGSYVDILKGVTIKNNSVVAYRSCVLHQFNNSNVLIGGYPAKVIKENVNWEL